MNPSWITGGKINVEALTKAYPEYVQFLRKWNIANISAKAPTVTTLPSVQKSKVSKPPVLFVKKEDESAPEADAEVGAGGAGKEVGKDKDKDKDQEEDKEEDEDEGITGTLSTTLSCPSCKTSHGVVIVSKGTVLDNLDNGAGVLSSTFICPIPVVCCAGKEWTRQEGGGGGGGEEGDGKEKEGEAAKPKVAFKLGVAATGFSKRTPVPAKSSSSSSSSSTTTTSPTSPKSSSPSPSSSNNNNNNRPCGWSMCAGCGLPAHAPGITCPLRDVYATAIAIEQLRRLQLSLPPLGRRSMKEVVRASLAIEEATVAAEAALAASARAKLLADAAAARIAASSSSGEQGGSSGGAGGSATDTNGNSSTSSGTVPAVPDVPVAPAAGSKFSAFNGEMDEDAAFAAAMAASMSSSVVTPAPLLNTAELNAVKFDFSGISSKNTAAVPATAAAVPAAVPSSSSSGLDMETMLAIQMAAGITGEDLSALSAFTGENTTNADGTTSNNLNAAAAMQKLLQQQMQAMAQLTASSSSSSKATGITPATSLPTGPGNGGTSVNLLSSGNYNNNKGAFGTNTNSGGNGVKPSSSSSSSSSSSMVGAGGPSSSSSSADSSSGSFAVKAFEIMKAKKLALFENEDEVDDECGIVGPIRDVVSTKSSSTATLTDKKRGKPHSSSSYSSSSGQGSSPLDDEEDTVYDEDSGEYVAASSKPASLSAYHSSGAGYGGAKGDENKLRSLEEKAKARQDVLNPIIKAAFNLLCLATRSARDNEADDNSGGDAAGQLRFTVSAAASAGLLVSGSSVNSSSTTTTTTTTTTTSSTDPPSSSASSEDSANVISLLVKCIRAMIVQCLVSPGYGDGVEAALTERFFAAKDDATPAATKAGSSSTSTASPVPPVIASPVASEGFTLGSNSSSSSSSRSSSSRRGSRSSGGFGSVGGGFGSVQNPFAAITLFSSSSISSSKPAKAFGGKGHTLGATATDSSSSSGTSTPSKTGDKSSNNHNKFRDLVAKRTKPKRGTSNWKLGEGDGLGGPSALFAYTNNLLRVSFVELTGASSLRREVYFAIVQALKVLANDPLFLPVLVYTTPSSSSSSSSTSTVIANGEETTDTSINWVQWKAPRLNPSLSGARGILPKGCTAELLNNLMSAADAYMKSVSNIPASKTSATTSKATGGFAADLNASSAAYQSEDPEFLAVMCLASDFVSEAGYTKEHVTAWANRPENMLTKAEVIAAEKAEAEAAIAAKNLSTPTKGGVASSSPSSSAFHGGAGATPSSSSSFLSMFGVSGGGGGGGGSGAGMFGMSGSPSGGAGENTNNLTSPSSSSSSSSSSSDAAATASANDFPVVPPPPTEIPSLPNSLLTGIEGDVLVAREIGLGEVPYQPSKGLADEYREALQEESYKKVEGLRSVHYHSTHAGSTKKYESKGSSSSSSTAASASTGGALGRNKRIMRVGAEMSRLQTERDTIHWQSSILVRADASEGDFMRAAITGPRGTPYQNGFFTFDISLPAEYPAVSPSVQFLTTGGGAARFNPNLYADGKVCLSLLGTWDGPGWSPNVSTLSQVLLSIQTAILVEKPFANEPGFEARMQTLNGKRSVSKHNLHLRLATMRHAMLEPLLRKVKGFEKATDIHFYYKKDEIKAQCLAWCEEANVAAKYEKEIFDRLRIAAAVTSVVQKECGYTALQTAKSDWDTALQSHAVFGWSASSSGGYGSSSSSSSSTTGAGGGGKQGGDKNASFLAELEELKVSAGEPIAQTVKLGLAKSWSKLKADAVTAARQTKTVASSSSTTTTTTTTSTSSSPLPSFSVGTPSSSTTPTATFGTATAFKKSSGTPQPAIAKGDEENITKALDTIDEAKMKIMSMINDAALSSSGSSSSNGSTAVPSFAISNLSEALVAVSKLSDALKQLETQQQQSGTTKALAHGAGASASSTSSSNSSSSSYSAYPDPYQSTSRGGRAQPSMQDVASQMIAVSKQLFAELDKIPPPAPVRTISGSGVTASGNGAGNDAEEEEEDIDDDDLL